MTYAQTVTGRIPAEKMGFTLPHEHVFWDLSFYLPKDLDRIVGIKKQIECGNVERILLSHDTVYKCMLRQYGGFGYEHIGKHILPFMRLQGYQEKWLNRMTVENPKNVFSFEE